MTRQIITFEKKEIPKMLRGTVDSARHEASTRLCDILLHQLKHCTLYDLVTLNFDLLTLI